MPLDVGPRSAGAQAKAGPVYDVPSEAISGRDLLRFDHSGERSSRVPASWV